MRAHQCCGSLPLYHRAHRAHRAHRHDRHDRHDRRRGRHAHPRARLHERRGCDHGRLQLFRVHRVLVG